MNPSNSVILITVDVEDWFQVENFKQYIPFSSWPSYELRVEKNTHRLLDLFDTSSATHNPIKATFFILGWIGERLPHLVREIFARGHEVASHGYSHGLCVERSERDLKEDLCDSKKLLEDIIGKPTYGYRAPSFSISNDILKTIEECGYLYDSSFNSFGIHDRYGRIALSADGQNGIATRISETFYELPVSNIKLGKSVLPWGGGGYFRLIPLLLFRLGVQSILKKEHAYLFYIHPWEVDPEQPKVNEAPSFFRFRHYNNLSGTYKKLKGFIESFKEHRFISCGRYIEEICGHSLRPIFEKEISD